MEVGQNTKKGVFAVDMDFKAQSLEAWDRLNKLAQLNSSVDFA